MTVATSMRVPARQGLPNRMPGSSEMPGKISMPLLLCLRPAPVVKKRGGAKQPATGNLQPATARRAGPASNHQRAGTGRLDRKSAGKEKGEEQRGGGGGKRKR